MKRKEPGTFAKRVMLGGLLPSLVLSVAAVVLLFADSRAASLLLSRQIADTAVTLFSVGLSLGFITDILKNK